MWGHATAHCNLTPKCLKCAGSHKTGTACGENPEIKCVNCDGQHLANSIECVVYKRIINNRRINKRVTSAKEPQQKTYVPAPLPEITPC